MMAEFGTSTFTGTSGTKYEFTTFSRNTKLKMQDSSALKNLSEAGALIVRPPDAPALVAGDAVPVLPLENL